jgi:hypothetical protein
MYERFEDGEKIRHGTRGYRSIHIKRPNTGKCPLWVIRVDFGLSAACPVGS